MPYRTKTYIAGEWEGDNAAINQIFKWNEGDRWSLHFVDAHSYKQSYDTSMPCSIKASLSDRLSRSKTFILVVGNHTKTVRKGSCEYQNCGRKIYDYLSLSPGYKCSIVGKVYSTESFINYECRLAYEAWKNGLMKIVVLYNSATINKSKCPEILRDVGTHSEMKTYNIYFGIYQYDYYKVKKAIEG